jgi:hypothetical protein
MLGLRTGIWSRALLRKIGGFLLGGEVSAETPRGEYGMKLKTTK